MENKLNLLTKKIYKEGIEKANLEADEIINKAKEEAGKIKSSAEKEAEKILLEANKEAENLKNRAESEITLSRRQTMTTIKQRISDLVSDKISQKMAEVVFDEKKYVMELVGKLVSKWDIDSGNIDVSIVVNKDEKKEFDSFMKSNYKKLLDKGLEVKVDNLAEPFVIAPKDGGYKIGFSEELFKSFFSQYVKGVTKTLLFKD